MTAPHSTPEPWGYKTTDGHIIWTDDAGRWHVDRNPVPVQNRTATYMEELAARSVKGRWSHRARTWHRCPGRIVIEGGAPTPWTCLGCPEPAVEGGWCVGCDPDRRRR